MRIFSKKTDMAFMEGYQTALTNAKTTPEILEALNQIGVSVDLLEEGTALYEKANKAYSLANIARKERLEAYDTFDEKRKALQEFFLLDLKKARIAFLHNRAAQTKLDLNSTLRQDRLKQFNRAVNFYNMLNDNPDLLEPLSKLSITAEDVTARIALADEAVKARAKYMLEKGISQNATFAKKEAFSNLSKYMTQFFALAKDAFKDQPQLMESLGFVVKS